MADTDYLAASDGTGDAALMHVSSPRLTGATIIQVDSVVGVPAFFIGTYGSLGSDGFITAASKRDFFGHVNAGTLVIDKFAPGNTDAGNATNDVVVIKPNTASQNLIANFIKNGVVAGTGGWNVLGPTPDTVTCNGNRSYSLVFNGRDLTASLSAGMRLRTTRTIAAPTQCASFNGSTQYYSKTSPAGMTFTDDFTISAWVKLNSYILGTIASRYNGTSGYRLQIAATGQVKLSGFNASSANESNIVSNTSIPLNKWVHIQANLDMSAFATNTDGGAAGSTIAIDGVNVPATVNRAGTNPTALVQAGNLEIGSDNGGGNPFNGKIAQVAIYNAKITIANVLATISQGLAGTETSLISAYSLNNAITDLNTTNANNLTANGSVAATNADSPFGGQAGGTISSTLDYGIITKVAFSTNTTLTVQVPEGCTIPVSGGVAAVAYSTQRMPYGLPGQRDKWQLFMICMSGNSQSSPVQSTWYNLLSLQINVPLCNWTLDYRVPTQAVKVGSSADQLTTLSAANNTESNNEFTSAFGDFDGLSGNANFVNINQISNESLIATAQATYYLNQRTISSGLASIGIATSYGPARLILTNAYL